MEVSTMIVRTTKCNAAPPDIHTQQMLTNKSSWEAELGHMGVGR